MGYKDQTLFKTESHKIIYPVHWTERPLKTVSVMYRIYLPMSQDPKFSNHRTGSMFTKKKNRSSRKKNVLRPQKGLKILGGWGRVLSHRPKNLKESTHLYEANCGGGRGGGS